MELSARPHVRDGGDRRLDAANDDLTMAAQRAASISLAYLARLPEAEVAARLTEFEARVDAASCSHRGLGRV
jgi:hypothetical protein